jgi:hypothetical protein
MVRRLKTTRASAYRFPRYLEDQDFYCFSTESDEHNGDTEEGSGANSTSVQASPPASVIKLSYDEIEEEQAEDQEQGGNPDDHSDPEGSNPEDGDADEQPALQEWKVVVCHHDGGHGRFPCRGGSSTVSTCM